jgi:hypothetical protein
MARPKTAAAPARAPRVAVAPAAPAATHAAAAPSAVTRAVESPARARRVVTNEDIRVRAYFLALEHGGKGGNLDFWLRAERELRQPSASLD